MKVINNEQSIVITSFIIKLEWFHWFHRRHLKGEENTPLRFSHDVGIGSAIASLGVAAGRSSAGWAWRAFEVDLEVSRWGVATAQQKDDGRWLMVTMMVNHYHH